jgi:hypothetical protein
MDESMDKSMDESGRFLMTINSSSDTISALLPPRGSEPLTWIRGGSTLDRCVVPENRLRVDSVRGDDYHSRHGHIDAFA